MDTGAKVLMGFTLLNGTILSLDLLYNIFHTIFPL